MQYFEEGPDGKPLLCRIENFLPYHTNVRNFVRGKITEVGALYSMLVKNNSFENTSLGNQPVQADERQLKNDSFTRTSFEDMNPSITLHSLKN